MFAELRCRETTLDYFDRLVDGHIVRPPPSSARDGEDDEPLRVVSMMDVYLPGGVTVGDQLRGMFMLGEGSEFHDKYSADEKAEFLYHLMWRVCTGGVLNQWEDNFVVYKNFVRDLYRDIVCVARDAGTGELTLLSHIYQICAVDNLMLFPRDDESEPSNFNYCYVAVNPTRKEVVVMYHLFNSNF
jgi:hypothetical protein